MNQPPPPPARSGTPAPFGGRPQMTPAPQITAGLSPEVLTMARRLMTYIGDDECSEVLFNGPNEITRKVRGMRIPCDDVKFGSVEIYHRVINEILLAKTDTQDRIDGDHVVLEGQLAFVQDGRLPMYARVHVVAPPGVEHAKVTIAKRPRIELGLADLVNSGVLTANMAEFLRAAARGRRTIVVSGPTGVGKTTMLQALTHAFNPHDRVVVIEETPELRLPLHDVVYLRATLPRPGLEDSQIYTLEFWTKQANRMRMDRVIVGESRGAELADWLLAANSGAEGSALSIHANSARRCLDKMLSLATKSDTAPSEPQLRREIAATVDLIVQMGIVNGRHRVTEIEEISGTVAAATGVIQTQTLFAFDTVKGRHVAMGHPSEDMLLDMSNFGVQVNNDWFRNQ
jgi:pilus assembly protein CpaF